MRLFAQRIHDRRRRELADEGTSGKLSVHDGLLDDLREDVLTLVRALDNGARGGHAVSAGRRWGQLAWGYVR